MLNNSFWFYLIPMILGLSFCWYLYQYSLKAKHSRLKVKSNGYLVANNSLTLKKKAPYSSVSPQNPNNIPVFSFSWPPCSLSQEPRRPGKEVAGGRRRRGQEPGGGLLLTEVCADRHWWSPSWHSDPGPALASVLSPDTRGQDRWGSKTGGARGWELFK